MKELINPPGTEPIYDNWHFSQAVKAGNTIYVSGQTGMEGTKPVEGVEAQTRIAFSSVEKVLASAGATLEHVVEMTTFHVGMEGLGEFAKVKDEFFPKEYPAWTAVGVTALAIPGLLVEVRVTAVLPD